MLGINILNKITFPAWFVYCHNNFLIIVYCLFQAVNLLSSCQVTCLDYLNSRLLVAGTTNGTLILWDIESQKIIQRFALLVLIALAQIDCSLVKRFGYHVYNPPVAHM